MPHNRDVFAEPTAAPVRVGLAATRRFFLPCRRKLGFTHNSLTLKGRETSMPSLTEWKVPPAYQPRPGDYSFDLDRALSSVVGLHSIIPADAFTAETLGHRARRQWRRDRRRPGADDRLSDHRGGSGLAASRRRPRGGRPRARLRCRHRFWPGAGARPHRSRSAADRLVSRDQHRRSRRGRWRRRTHALRGEPDRRQAGVRRLLGISAG